MSMPTDGSADVVDQDVDVSGSQDSGSSDSGATPQSSAPQQRAPQQAAPGQSPQAAAAARSNWEVMNNFRQLPQFRDLSEQQIAHSLYQTTVRERAASQQLTQFQQLYPNIQKYLADKPQFDEWQKARMAPPAAAQHPGAKPAEEKKPWWNPPQVRDSHKRFLVRDPETGREVISPDAPIDARQSLEEQMAFKQDFARKFLEDPEAALGPMVEGRAKQIAQEIVQQTMTQRDNESFVDQIRDENKDWLFNEDGSVTTEAIAVHKYVEQGRSMGITSPEQRWQYARDKVEHDLLLRDYAARMEVDQQPEFFRQPQQARQFAPPAPPVPPQQDTSSQDAARAARAQANMDFLRREASRSPNRSAGTTNNDPRASRPASYEQMLLDTAAKRGLL